MCELTSLPSFKDESASKAWNEQNGSLPVLARWKCQSCGGVHHWSTLPSYTNGNHRAGTFAIPERILKLIPKECILVGLAGLDNDTAYKQANKNQSKASQTRIDIKRGVHPKQTRKAVHK